jgi:hypothetical protein
MGCRVGERAGLLLSVGFVVATLLLSSSRGVAAEVPAQLPRYHIDLVINTDTHKALLRQRITWTNTTRTPANHLTFNFYPHYRVPQGDYIHLAKTLELLRLQPSLGIDRCGRFGVVKEARLLSLADKQFDQLLPFAFDADNVTALRVPLPAVVDPGQSVTVELLCEYFLPNKQGRLGHFNKVTFLTNSLPVLAYCDDSGWQPKPFVPWHQPWFNEAGHFTASITLPVNQVLAVPAKTKTETVLENGYKRIETEPFLGRDFAILSSNRYQEFRSQTRLPDGRTVVLRCYAFAEHAFYAQEILKSVGEAIPIFSKWFGPFPYDIFTIAESYFGWNGNECAGLIMIDERVFGMPHLARGYVEYLVSHETCHQWWYNLVGTNGYSESFMDEGAAVHFTHRMLDVKRGKNNELLEWPQALNWLPNIKRDNYRWAGMYYAIRNNEMYPAAQDLPRYQNLFGLFTGAYDRGSKVFGMIEAQLGEAAFLDFTRLLVEKYSWRVLQVKDFRAELEAYSGRDWGEFFERWVYGKGLTDWKVETVRIELASGPRVRHWHKHFRSLPQADYTATAVVRQTADWTEPTDVSFAFEDGPPVRVPVGLPQVVELPEQRAIVIPLGEDRWEVRIALNAMPDQITVDPDRVLLDADPGDNEWRSKPCKRVTPLYTMLDETDMTSDYDRWNFIGGPWIWGASYLDPWYTRSTMVGLRAGANRPQQFRGGVYAAIRSDYRDLVAGADAVWLGDHKEVGLNWERRIGGPWGGQAGASGPNRAVAYFRHVLKPGSSLYLPPVMYQDIFATYQDNFLPFPQSSLGARWNRLTMAGYHYRLNLYTPYWDPECGVWVDVMAAGGVVEFTGWKGMGQGRLELAAVHHLPDFLGPLRHVRFAGRVVGMAAWPDDGQFYALGGGTLYRGFDLAERQGSLLWLSNAELRWPLARDVEWDILDHTIGARNVWLTTFYDVGGIYANGRQVGNVAHALGLGLRVEVAIFSFIERATLRVDAAKTINTNTGWQFWFGFQQAF